MLSLVVLAMLVIGAIMVGALLGGAIGGVLLSRVGIEGTGPAKVCMVLGAALGIWLAIQAWAEIEENSKRPSRGPVPMQPEDRYFRR